VSAKEDIDYFWMAAIGRRIMQGHMIAAVN